MGPSGKQRKAQLQLKRAIRRGDVPKHAPEPSTRGKKQRRVPKPGHTLQTRLASDQAAQAARKLQSAFVKLDREFLDETRRLAGILAPQRPIPRDLAILDERWVRPPLGEGAGELCVPQRPKWRYGMTKAEVDGNEQAYFRRWLSQQDAEVERWRNALKGRDIQSDQATQSPATGARPDVVISGTSAMPHPPTHFERNLEVWRQLWRVTEISDILLVLLDSRCPLLHLPSSLASYLSLPRTHNATTNTRRKSKLAGVVLVLTKVDISGPTRVAAWTTYLHAQYPGVPVVPVEAYIPKKTSIDGSATQGRVKYEPHIAGTFRERLVRVLQHVHGEILEPPEWVKGNEEKIQKWKPKVRRDVDWERVMYARGAKVGKVDSNPTWGEEDDGEINAQGQSDADNEDAQETLEQPEFLTVGLIGQPNVGKSSLLNALFETTKVRASRTPGKTKHFQTLFWTPDVRLVDCPGLVMPSFVPMDIQVLSGVLPISRVAAIPFCVHQLARFLPLERVFCLTHPSIAVQAAEDKRTWRDGQRVGQKEEAKAALKWTATDIMTAYANKKGWVTAKAGRPDINRAGNAILRLVSQGQVPWAFWPPGHDVSIGVEGGDGIWLRDGVMQHDADDFEMGKWDDIDESNDDYTTSGSDMEVTDGSEEEEGDDTEELEEISVTKGRFDALNIE